MTESKTNMTPLPPDIERLLKNEQLLNEMPGEAQERVLNRVAATLGVSLTIAAGEAVAANIADAAAKSAGDSIGTDR